MIRNLMRLWLFASIAYWAYYTLVVDDDTQSKDLFYKFERIFPTLEDLAKPLGITLDKSGFLLTRTRVRRWMILRALAFTVIISLTLKLLLTKVQKSKIGKVIRGFSTLSFVLATFVIAFVSAGNLIHFYKIDFNSAEPLRSIRLVEHFPSDFPEVIKYLLFAAVACLW